MKILRDFQSWAPPQRDRQELLDAGRASETSVRESLRDLRRINSLLGNSQIVVNEIIALLQKRGLQKATILDVGTGSADLPVCLLKAARAHHFDLRVIAMDCKALHLQIAREELSNEFTNKCRETRDEIRNRVLLLGGDAFHLPLENESVDFVISSLFLHHFRPPQIELLLNEFARVARHGFVMNDLVRHYAPMVFFKAAWPIFARSNLTRYDSAASFRRAYTVEEMRRHLASMQLGVTRVAVKPHFFRLCIIGEKS